MKSDEEIANELQERYRQEFLQRQARRASRNRASAPPANSIAELNSQDSDTVSEAEEELAIKLDRCESSKPWVQLSDTDDEDDSSVDLARVGSSKQFKPRYQKDYFTEAYSSLPASRFHYDIHSSQRLGRHSFEPFWSLSLYQLKLNYIL